MRPSYQTYYTKVDKDWNGLYKIELGGRVASGEDKLKRYVEILKRKSGKTELKRELEKEWLNDNIEIITEDEFEELKSEILEELVD